MLQNRVSVSCCFQLPTTRCLYQLGPVSRVSLLIFGRFCWTACMESQGEEISSWLEREVTGCQFQDLRHGRRFRTLLGQLSASGRRRVSRWPRCQPSSPYGSAAHGSCGIRSALEPARSPECASANLSTGPAAPRGDASSVPVTEHSSRAVRSPDSSAPDTSLGNAAARALQLFSEHVLQHRLVQRQFRHQLLQPRVLVTKLLDLSAIM